MANEEMIVRERNRRRRYFIDRGFQSKYVALLVVFIVSLGIAGLLVLVLGSGEAAAADLRGAIVAMLAVMVAFMGLTAWYGVRFSHRIVGPVFALSRHFQWVESGDYTRDLQLRDKDEFQNIALGFNAMLAALRDRAREDAAVMSRVDAGLEELARAVSASAPDGEAARELIARLRRELDAARAQNEGFVSP
jgi:methyl-accepting chemotaxis protein